jgi:putative transposase
MLEAMDGARNTLGFHLWAYVIMPDHAHLLLWYPIPEYSVERTLQCIKQSVSRRAIEFLRAREWEEPGSGPLRLDVEYFPV